MGFWQILGIKPKVKHPSFTRFKLLFQEPNSACPVPVFKVLIENSGAEFAVGAPEIARLFDMVDTVLKTSSDNYEHDYGVLKHLFQNMMTFCFKCSYEIEYGIRTDRKRWHYRSSHLSVNPPRSSTIVLTDDTIDGLIDKIDDSRHLIDALD